MGAKLIALFFLLIVIGAIVYAYQSGIIMQGYNALSSFSLASSSSYLPKFPSQSNNNGGYGPGAVQWGTSGISGSSGSSGSGSSPAKPTVNLSDIPPGFTPDQLSPYFHQVRFGSVYAGTQLGYGFSNNGLISLRPSYGIPINGIDVTGWNIKATHGGEFIPQAVLYYDPLGLNPPSDIILKSGDTLNIYSSSAPVNLRLNECIGYLPNKKQFNPQLPMTCPYITTNAEIQLFSGACQNYILSLGGCKVPDLNDPRIPSYDYSCRQYISTHFNYKACYDAHITEKNFLSNEVRVWMGSTPLDQYHDRVQLLDKDGLLVDYRSY